MVALAVVLYCSFKVHFTNHSYVEPCLSPFWTDGFVSMVVKKSCTMNCNQLFLISVNYFAACII